MDGVDPRVRAWIEVLRASGWAFLVADRDFRLVYVSDELKGFLREEDDAKLGYGKSLTEVLTYPVWLDAVTPESTIELARTVIPFFLRATGSDPSEVAAVVPEPLRSLSEGADPSEALSPDVCYARFDYIAENEMTYPVDLVCTILRDESGAPLGMWTVFYMGLRPGLVSLLARGNEQMYERMAALVEPRRREAAVLFAELDGAARLSRQLPSATYFALMRSATTAMDEVIAARRGIIGKHAADGVTALFLVDDLGSASRAAQAAILTARELGAGVARAVEDLGEELGIEAPDCALRVGVHWGGGLYIGQLVPGGRLDVAALGDAMNECSCLQKAAPPGAILASKQLVEQLAPAEAEPLGVDPDTAVYTPLGEVEGVPPDVVRDAAGLAATPL